MGLDKSAGLGDVGVGQDRVATSLKRSSLAKIAMTFSTPNGTTSILEAYRYVLADVAKPVPEPLSVRQAECLAWASKGMTSKEIGREIGISPSTVDTHLRVASAKLQVGNRRQAIRQMTNPDGCSKAFDECLPQASDLLSQSTASIGFFPPLGGSPNTLPIGTRLVMVGRVALLGTMALAAIVTTISGVVSILSR